MSNHHGFALTSASVRKKNLGGFPVQFKPQEGVVLLANEAHTYEEWAALRDTIDRMYERIGKKEPQRPNIVPFNPAPWFLRWLVEGFVPKMMHHSKRG